MSKPNWTPIQIRLGDIIPWTDNPRFSTKKQAERIIASEKKFGQPIPFSVSPYYENSNKVDCYDGHQRYSAWLTVYGEDFKVNASQADRHLDLDERREFVLAVHNATGSWNWDIASGWPAEKLKGWGMDGDTLKGWKADVTALGSFLESEKPAKDAPADVDRAGELLEKWGVQSGDLWQIGDHRLICGDCTDAATVARVMGGEFAELVITDPPYNFDMPGGGVFGGENTAQIYKNIEGSFGSDFEPEKLLEVLPMVFKKDYCVIYIFCNKDLLLDYLLWAKENKLRSNVLVWHKKSVVPFGDGYVPDVEYLVYMKKNGIWNNGTNLNRSKVLEYDQERQVKDHPTPKPVAMIENQIALTTSDNGVVFEPFSGSGTCLVACENLSRRCRAIEISPAYVAVALERMATAFPHLEIKRI